MFLQFWYAVLTWFFPHFVTALFPLSWHLTNPPSFDCSQHNENVYKLVTTLIIFDPVMSSVSTKLQACEVLEADEGPLKQL